MEIMPQRSAAALLSILALVAYSALNLLNTNNGFGDISDKGGLIRSPNGLDVVDDSHVDTARRLRILENNDIDVRIQRGIEGLDKDSDRYAMVVENRLKWMEKNQRKNRSERKKKKRVKEIENIAIEGGWADEVAIDAATPLPEEDQVQLPTSVCQLPIDRREIDLSFLDQFTQCPGSSNPNTILLLDGNKPSGIPGYNLLAFFHALQYARDQDIQLGVIIGSWVMEVIFDMWLAIDRVNWERRFEDAFCLQIITDETTELAGWTIQTISSSDFVNYVSTSSLEEYMNHQMKMIRTIWGAYNTGAGFNNKGNQVSDMCSGIDALFGGAAGIANYSVIHSYYQDVELIGHHFLRDIHDTAGSSRKGAIFLEPSYVKSILRPLDMLQHPIVFITNTQDLESLQGLLADPEIGPQIQLVPDQSAWYGGDLTLATMSNVFIGNPASTFATFAAKSRLALGIGNTYLFRVRDKNGQWTTSCEESCVFDSSALMEWA